MKKSTYSILCSVLLLTASLVWGASIPLKIQMESWSPYYRPEAPSVGEGTAIRWENPTATHHTVTHDGCKGEGPCLFDSGAIPPHGEYELPDLPPGLYPYHCTLHPIMRGSIVVTGPTRPSEI